MRPILALVLLLALTVAGSAAQAQHVLTVYGATDTAAIAEVIGAFERNHPGVRVQYREFNTVELFDDVRTHIGDPAYSPDVMMSSAMDLQVSLVNLGLAHRFDPGNEVEMAWRSELFGFTEEPAAIVYNRAAFRDRKLPHNRADLAGMIRDDPGFFEGRIGTYDIRQSGVGYLFATQDAIRDHQHFRLIESFGRAGTRAYCCTADMLDATASGELVLSYNVIGSYALARAAADPRIGIHFMEDYNLVMARTALVLRNAPNMAAAESFVAFLLSPDGQAAISRVSALTARIPGHDAIEGTSGAMNGKRFIHIRLGIALLAYLDRLKREKFLASWEAAMLIESRLP